MLTIGRTHRTYHAPWSRRYTTFYLRGTWAHELQIGGLVLQVRRFGPQGRRMQSHRWGRVHTWTRGVAHVWYTKFYTRPWS